jgi:hypothetical protein
MRPRVPYPKRPPGQYRTPLFYFRGDEALREQEYLIDEYKTALAQRRRAEYDLSVVERELKASIETLRQREGYTAALASFLDADTEGNLAEQHVKRRLPHVEAEIRKAELDLQDALGVQLPAVAGPLQQDRALLLIESKRVSESLAQSAKSQMAMGRDLARILTSLQYRSSLDFESKRINLNEKLDFLKTLLDKSKKKFGKIKE